MAPPHVHHYDQPAFVIDRGARTDLGVVRALGRAGVPVHLLSSRARTAASVSRYVQQTHRIPRLTEPAEEVESAIARAARRVDARPVFVFTWERAVLTVARNADRYRAFVDHDLPAVRVLEDCIDKARFLDRAVELGLPVPRTRVVRTAADAEHAVDEWYGAVYVKPLDNVAWLRLPPGLVPSVKGGAVRSADALRALLARLQDHGAAALVQELVEGPDHDHADVHACRVAGSDHLACVFTGRKLRLAPPFGGLATFARSEWIPDLAAATAHVLHALDYTGLANVNWKYHHATGRWALLEVNVRASLWSVLDQAAGANVVLAAYLAAAGRPVPEMRQRDGVHWLDFSRDHASSRVYRAHGLLGTWEWIRSLARARSFAFFDERDLRPWLFQVRYGTAY